MPIAGGVRYLEALAPEHERARGALVLIHAFPLNARMWEPQLVMAARGWRVIAPQLRGFDGSNGSRGVASIDDYAADVVDLLDGLHIKDAVVAGLSMGGYVAFALLRLAPTYIRGLVLADTRAQADTPDARSGRQRMLTLVEQQGVAPVTEELIPKLLGATTRARQPQMIDRVRELAHANAPEAVAGALRAMMNRPDSTPLLASMHAPTLIVVGDEDVVTPPAEAEAMHGIIPGSRLVRISGAGHLSNLEQPDAFNAALAHFLDHRV